MSGYLSDTEIIALAVVVAAILVSLAIRGLGRRISREAQRLEELEEVIEQVNQTLRDIQTDNRDSNRILGEPVPSLRIRDMPEFLRD
jgi:hypothetical protein